MSNPWEMDWGSPQSAAPQGDGASTPPWQMNWSPYLNPEAKKRAEIAPDFEDIAKSYGIGAAKGAVGLAGMPQDVGELVARGIDTGAGYVANKFGIDYQPSPNQTPPFGSENIQKQIEQYTGPFYQPKTEGGRVAEKVGEFTPASMIGPGGILAKFGRQAVMPAIGSEVGRQMTGGPWGELAGAMVGSAINPARLLTPAPSSSERQVLANTLKQEGIPLTAGQTTGNRPLRWAESVSGDIPFGSGRAASLAEHQKEQFTAAALRRIGETNATRATPDVIDRNFTRIGNEFDRLSGSTSFNFDRQLGNDLAQTLRDYTQLVPASSRAPVVENTLNDLMNMGRSGPIGGETYQALRSRLDRAARGAKADPNLSEALFGIRNSLDDAMERSLTAAGRTDDVRAWQTARNEYRNILVLEKAATAAGENTAQGLISPSALRGAVVGQNRRAYARGQGDYADLARSGAGILGDLPQSGTAPRENMQEIFRIIGPLLGAEAATGGTGLVVGGSGAAMAAPALMSHLLMSGPVQRYFGNQLLNQGANMSPQRRLLMSQELMRTQQQPGQ